MDKICSVCGTQFKAIGNKRCCGPECSEMFKHSRVLLYYLAHRDKARDDIRKYRATEQGKLSHRATVRAYQATERGMARDSARFHNRRAQLRSGPKLTADVILDVKEQFLGYCPYCWEKIGVGTIEHVLPVSRGGTNDRNNLAWVCQTCNGQKNDKTLKEFRIYQENLVSHKER